MATELPSVVVDTPAPTTVITTTVKRSWIGRLTSGLLFLLTLTVGLLQQIGTINLQALGFTPTQAAWGAAVIFLAQYVLLQLLGQPTLVSTQASPGSTNTTGQG